MNGTFRENDFKASQQEDALILFGENAPDLLLQCCEKDGWFVVVKSTGSIPACIYDWGELDLYYDKSNLKLRYFKFTPLKGVNNNLKELLTSEGFVKVEGD